MIRSEERQEGLRLVRRGYGLMGVVFLSLTVPSTAFAESGFISGWKNLWQTPDQQAQAMFEDGEFAAAAETFADPMWRGVALYRAGEFEQSASVFGRIQGPEAAFNRGNALIFLGSYDEAIISFECALDQREGWQQAEENLALAQARQAALAPPDSDEGGTGGMLPADEIVFDDTGRVNKSSAEEIVDGGGGMTDQEMRAVWLRRVQNDPATFLRARFSYQLARDQSAESSDE